MGLIAKELESAAGAVRLLILDLRLILGPKDRLRGDFDSKEYINMCVFP
jgi:hypothetical protein